MMLDTYSSSTESLPALEPDWNSAEDEDEDELQERCPTAANKQKMKKGEKEKRSGEKPRGRSLWRRGEKKRNEK